MFERPSFIVTVQPPVVEGSLRALSAIPWVLANDIGGHAVRWVARFCVLIVLLSILPLQHLGLDT